MTGKQLLDILKKHGGYITGDHIVLTSGRHTDSYINKDAIYPHTKDIARVCKEIALKFKDKKIDVVAAPALGGIILSQWTAYYLSKLSKKEVIGVYTEKTPEKDQIFTRGYDKLIKGKNVLVVEDVTTTGGSVLKVVNSINKVGGKTVAICVLVNRDKTNINSKSMGVPFYSLVEVNFNSWEENDCLLCKKSVEINTTVGKGKEFLSKHNK